MPKLQLIDKPRIKRRNGQWAVFCPHPKSSIKMPDWYAQAFSWCLQANRSNSK